MGVCNTILSAYTKYRHLGYCCTHPSISTFGSANLSLAKFCFVLNIHAGVYDKRRTISSIRHA